MANLSIRGVDAEVLRTLKRVAKEEGASVNALVLRLIERELGRGGGGGRRRRYGDLDALAGSWSEEEAAEFLARIEPFEAIDAALWE